MDNSPLHLAASNGYTRSMKLLLTVHPNLLDCVNKHKVSVLSLPASVSPMASQCTNTNKNACLKSTNTQMVYLTFSWEA